MNAVSKRRPFYSVVIPIYNARKYINNCLTSLVNQKMPKHLMEVIICDDCSPEECWDLVDKFEDKLNIIRCKTDYNFAPGNTREKAMEYVTGEWVTFLDQDDAFIENTLGPIRDKIIESKEKYYVISDFVETYRPTGQVIRVYERVTGWNHGKFYNMDNLWRACNIHFKKDMFSHEDVYVTTNVSCAMRRLRAQPMYTDIMCYSWVQNEESLTHMTYDKMAGKHSFLEALFDDYIDSTGWVYMQRYIEGFIDKDYAMDATIGCLGYCYIYIQSFIFQDPTGYIRENLDLCRKFFIKIKQEFQMNNDDIYNHFAKDDANVFMQVQKAAAIGAGPFIPQQTLREFLDYMHKDIEKHDPQKKKKYKQ